ncbi:carboxypeptidase-like regulatory domain-containing protein [Pseudoalteromonas tunicata]|uniref:Chitinase n=1 Tax=Pseudoalteromonas tunicata D2 TaxID=87626 RepID=A4CER0_9GAMM|nr:carboxypeptidase-like regulatory domain-containing protein [Pseudoalteromonas tunicata]ATC96050.1 hypothetical protein PTUN_a3775 [Pseudoalteromonas tunicata]AXT31579.1 carboxypeptidase regulatory-like domain-containing protein [Pseudoalteromonas tunicata]EAR26789.1 chitinase [Pseudoalteromonas tunicata D2]
MNIHPAMKSFSLLACFSAALLLSGCGGSDSSDDTVNPPVVQNQKPQVSISGDKSVEEGKSLKLTAQATDADGSIASYAWSIKSGPTFDLGINNASEFSFTAPDVDADKNLVLSVLVTDNQGATASADYAITIKRKVSTVTITGLITDKPLANATITAKVGDEEFAATSDANGVYSVTLTVDESAQNTLVQLYGIGDNANNPEVEFYSQLNSVSVLLSAAGEDAVLNKDELFGVNVTNVSTAEYALFTRAGQIPTNEQELAIARLAIDAQEKLTLAALIKIVVDSDDNTFVLPEGVTSTFDLVDDVKTSSEFIIQVNQVDPTLIDKTIEEIKKDDTLVDNGSLPLAGQYLITSPQYYGAKSTQLDLNQDGTGTLTGETKVAITWVQAADGFVTLNSVSPLVNILSGSCSINNTFIDNCRYQAINHKFRILAEDKTSRSIEWFYKEQVIDINLNQVVQETATNSLMTMIDKNQTLTVSAADIEGSWYIDDLIQNNGQLFAGQFVFQNDGSGELFFTDGSVSLAFQWQLVANRLEILGDTFTHQLWLFKDINKGYQFSSNVITQDAQSVLTRTGLMIKQEDVFLNVNSAVGRWSIDLGFKVPGNYGDLDFYDDGSMTINLQLNRDSWGLKSGELVRDRFYHPDLGLVGKCPATYQCQLARTVVHKLLAVDGDNYLVTRNWFENDNPIDDSNNWTNGVYTGPTGLTFVSNDVLSYLYTPTQGVAEFAGYWLYGLNLYTVEQGVVNTRSFNEVYVTGQPTQYNIYAKEWGAGDAVGTYKVKQGQLQTTIANQTYFYEIKAFDRNFLTVCRFTAGGSCAAGETVKLYLNKEMAITDATTPVAQSHPLDGTWYDPTIPEFILILQNGKWIQVEFAVDDLGTADEFPGYEIGNFTWDQASGSFSVDILEDTNGVLGYDSDLTHTITVAGDNLTIMASDGEVLNLKRVISASNSLVGGYTGGDISNNRFFATVMLNEGVVVELEHEVGNFGIRASNYTHNATTGYFTWTPFVDQIADSSSDAIVRSQGDRLLWKDNNEFGAMKRTSVTTTQPYFNEASVLGSYNLLANGQNVPFSLQSGGNMLLGSGVDAIAYQWRMEQGQLLVNEITPDTGTESAGFIFSPTALNGTGFDIKLFSWDQPVAAGNDPVNHDFIDASIQKVSQNKILLNTVRPKHAVQL